MRFLKFSTTFWVLLLLSTGLIPIAAQEDDREDETCPPSLLSTIETLLEAQAALGEGETDSALESIADAEAELSEILMECGVSVEDEAISEEEGASEVNESASADDESDVNALIPQLLIADGNEFSFRYPAEWIVQQFEVAVYGAANNEDGLDIFSAGSPSDVEPGSQAIAVFFQNPSQIIPQFQPGDDIDRFAALFRDQFVGLPDITDIGEIEVLDVEGHDARRIDLGGENFEVILAAIDYLNMGRVAIFITIATPDDMIELEPIFVASAQSFSVPAEDPNTSEDEEDTASSALPPVPVQVAEFDWANATVADVQPINEVIANVDARTAVLSPDGEMVAWVGESGICVYTFTDEATECYPFVENIRTRPTRIRWSPASDKIVFTENFVIYLFEPDIHLLDLNIGTMMNLTEDNQDGGALSMESRTIDILPFWHPNGDIYFFRVDQEIEDYVALQRIAAEAGAAPELVRVLTGELPYLSVYERELIYLDGSVAISPDGQTIAMLVQSTDRQDQRNGIWTMDATGDAPPEFVMAQTAFTQGFPAEVFEDSIVQPNLVGLSWSGDGEGLYVISDLGGLRRINYTVPYHIDVEDRELTPLIDFSNLEGDDLFVVDPETGFAPEFLLPRAAVVPRGTDIALIQNWSGGGETAGISRLSAEGGVDSFSEFLDASLIPSNFSTVGDNGRVLLFGFLYTLEES